MEKNVLPKFDCFSDPSTIVPRQTSFEMYADVKGLIINEGTTAATKQRRRAMLLHLARPDVQEIFTTLTETGDAANYASAVEALNAYFFATGKLSISPPHLLSRRTQVRQFNSLSLA